MNRSLRTGTLVSVALAALFLASPALAQIQDQTDYLRLSWRFDQLLKTKDTEAAAAVQTGIANERSAIRSEIEKDITAYLKSEENTDSVDLVRVSDKQRSIVAALNERIDGTNADLSLLEKEEEYYKQREKTGTGSPPPGQIMLTKSYPELLGKKAVLEERLAALQAFRSTQEDRLKQLQSEQQVHNIGILLTILTYIGIFFLVFWGERIIRNAFLNRLPHRRIRYAIAKAFTLIVYVTLAFWFIQQIFSEYPSLLTIVALVGAALVIVMQDAIKGMAGWLGLRNAVSIGQRVTIGPVTGDVIDIGILYTTLLVARTTTLEAAEQVGKIVRVPNERFLSQVIVNYHSTSDFENVELPIRIARSSEWQKAHTILEDILRQETESFAKQAQRQTAFRMRGFYHAHEPPGWRVYMALTPEREVEFEVCFLAPIGQRRAVTSRITMALLHRFAEAGIDMKVKE